nr:carboxypeptidase-like regulatory domain-containing protein [Robiginitalea sp. SC105]
MHVGSITAQEAPAGRSELVGVVSEEGVGIADVHVLNLTATSAVITDENGYFRIDTAPGDTLMFSAVRYKRRTLVVRPEMLRALRLEVPLEPFVNELDEVVVSPYNLSGDLDADLGRLPEDRTVTSFSLGLPNAARRQWTNTEKKFNEATTGGGIVPLNPILNYFSGRTRRLKKQMAYESRYRKSVEMREQFADSVLTRELGVPRERLPDFMYFCEVDSLFEAVADSGDQLRVWAFLRRKSEEYRKNNNLD